MNSAGRGGLVDVENFGFVITQERRDIVRFKLLSRLIFKRSVCWAPAAVQGVAWTGAPISAISHFGRVTC